MRLPPILIHQKLSFFFCSFTPYSSSTLLRRRPPNRLLYFSATFASLFLAVLGTEIPQINPGLVQSEVDKATEYRTRRGPEANTSQKHERERSAVDGRRTQEQHAKHHNRHGSFSQGSFSLITFATVPLIRYLSLIILYY